MNASHSLYSHLFAIVRFDLPINAENVLDAVSVVKVFQEKEAAEAEAMRLRMINDESKCIYQVQTSRLIPATGEHMA